MPFSQSDNKLCYIALYRRLEWGIFYVDFEDGEYVGNRHNYNSYSFHILDILSI